MSNMSRELSEYNRWLNEPTLTPLLREELQHIQGNALEITERFYAHLSFGTGGMRGEIGAGTNRLNIYTIRKASLGLAHYLLNQDRDIINIDEDQVGLISVVIAFDCRHFSQQFAETAALTLAEKGIKAYVFPTLRATPQLSFAVRKLQASAGIVITASHNPPEYNGYKVYNSDGAQLNLEEGEEVIQCVHQVKDELAVKVMDKQVAMAKGLFVTLDDQIDIDYYDYVSSLSLQPELIKEMANKIRIVFTPLHGTASIPVQKVLQKAGFTQVLIVQEQEDPDPNFSTVASPNPEEPAAFEMGITLAKKHNADIIIGTDPDADRMGLVVKDPEGNYKLLTGNQTGALLLQYILIQKEKTGQLTPTHTVCKTIVTSELGRKIAESYWLETIDTLTGFKFIGEKMKQFNEKGDRTFLFGYEESYGYLIGDEVRDKDAIQAALLSAELAAYYKSQGITVYEALENIYEKHGFYLEDLLSVTLKGREGMEKINSKMHALREHPPQEIGEQKITIREDYEQQKRYEVANGQVEKMTLPRANVLKYFLDDGTWVCIRPSGTEPKLKVYMSINGRSHEETAEKLIAIRRSCEEIVLS